MFSRLKWVSSCICSISSPSIVRSRSTVCWSRGSMSMSRSTALRSLAASIWFSVLWSKSVSRVSSSACVLRDLRRSRLLFRTIVRTSASGGLSGSIVSRLFHSSANTSCTQSRASSRLRSRLSCMPVHTSFR